MIDLNRPFVVPSSWRSLSSSWLVRNGVLTLICRADYSSMQTLIGFLMDECCAEEGCVAANDEEEAAA